MNRYYSYRNVREKLEQVQGPETGDLWTGMKAILDREMPEKEERKPIYGWFLTPKGLMSAAVTAGIIIITFMMYFGSGPEIDPATGKIKVPVKTPSVNNPVSESNSVGGKKTNISTAKDPAPANLREIPASDVVVTDQIAPVVPVTKDTASRQNLSAGHAMVNGDKATEAGKEVSDQIPVRNSDHLPAGNTVAANRTKKQATSGNLLSTSNDRNMDGTVTMPLVRSSRTNPAGSTRNSESEPVYSFTRRHVDPLPFLKADNLKSIPAIPADAVASLKIPEALKLPEVQKKGFVAGVSLNLNIPVSRQEMSTVSSGGQKVSLVDYMPSVYGQYHINNKLFVQAELQANSPQYTPKLLLASSQSYPAANKRETRNLELQKMYYLNLPVSVHYRPVKNLYVGAGVQYGYLHSTLFNDELISMERRGGTWQETSSKKKIAKGKPAKAKKQKDEVVNGARTPMSMVDTISSTFNTSDWRVFADVNYKWNRLNAGLRFNKGLNSYINTQAGNNVMQVRDKNESFQLYLRYDLVDLRRRKR